MATHPRGSHSRRANFSQITALGDIAYQLAPASPCVAPLFQRSVVKVAGKEKMLVEAVPLHDSRIDSIPISPMEYGLGIHGSDSAPSSRQLPVNVFGCERRDK